MNFSSLTKLATNLLISDLKTDLGKINFNQDKTNAFSSALSGGMKRKLHCGIALIGGSKVI